MVSGDGEGENPLLFSLIAYPGFQVPTKAAVSANWHSETAPDIRGPAPSAVVDSLKTAKLRSPSSLA